jgi:DNA-binding NarL/FixJ family response regulator
VADRLRLILADDNTAILDLMKHILQKEYEIVAAFSEGCSVIREAPVLMPDVIILDISMGELSGFDVTRELRREQCNSKIIFLTVHEELQFIRAAFDAGAAGYVFKSRMHTDLKTAINAVQAGKVFIPQAPIPQ